ncbi:DUF3055 domain-containing protein [Sutcliffiella cohnii]|uniref:DUF3055 domain-containing protein n=1 Tax=Sutcliffiella cohnii TaxID=33932 RepID=A0A223KS79_9BACI|nr:MULTISPECIES: DUF3055 domain-containing protein [Sutcliffiella]AST92208.1 hypothetical protein BC6307_13395 [Sutcliffiella cohnii]MED4015498.1 DUF3055 domain-containing protein [Sutcliffiella cohnii]WBL13439.1 DUF3055 domain-containing protein [Sutcliffiella sp. NC1]
MNLFDKLYDDNENVNARFVGFTTEEARYDFAIVYTNLFFGKPLVVCMQTGRSTLLDPKDITDLNHLQTVFRIDSKEQAEDLAEFFKSAIPNVPFTEQY